MGNQERRGKKKSHAEKEKKNPPGFSFHLHIKSTWSFLIATVNVLRYSELSYLNRKILF